MTVQIDKDLKFIFEALPSFGTRYSNLVMAYICLFGVTPFQIKAPKLRSILTEMKALFDSQSFAYQKKIYNISHAGIGEALDIVIKKNFETSLDSHNYLRRVMVTIAERESKEKSVRAEKDLRTREDRSLAGGGHDSATGVDCMLPGSGHDSATCERVSPEQAQQNLTRVRDLLGGLAK